MKLARFWARGVGKASGPGGPLEAVARGWSNRSIEEARRMGTEVAGKIASRLAAGSLDKDKQYLYGERPLPEPIIEEFTNGDGPRAVITRNVYGSLVLNTSTMMMLDIDREDPVPGQAADFDLLSSVLSLFGKSTAPEKPRASGVVDSIEHVARRHGLHVRVYRTAAGYRGIVTNRTFKAEEAETEALLIAFECDPLYIRLCKQQESFRARLTPKPWRCGIGLPPVSFPYETPQDEQKLRQWLTRYEANANRCATCQFVSSVGGDQVESSLQDLVARHDKETRAQSGLPLA